MCEDCYSPLKPKLDEDGILIVPSAYITAHAPVIEGWENYDTVINFYDPDERGVAQTFLYRQPKPVYFVCAYQADRRYMGPEEGGWGHEFRDLIDKVTVVVEEEIHAYAMCRALNRLAQRNGVAPGPYQWGTSGIVFTVDRFIGQDDTKFDGPVHYC